MKDGANWEQNMIESLAVLILLNYLFKRLLWTYERFDFILLYMDQ